MLTKKIEELKKSKISKLIAGRIKEFKTKKSSEEIFSELCFCLMTANFNAERSIKIQEQIGAKGFLNLPEQKLATKLKELGHRFPNTRAKYIVEARGHIGEIVKQVGQGQHQLRVDHLQNIRAWLVKNVKGLGLKESSHFLRNIGFDDFAIIDFHIVDLLVKEKLVSKIKSGALTKMKYLEIEQILLGIGKKVNLNLAELDLYLWYLETGKILK
ncbi:MAG: N-glycosylase/DNA lyase [Candidatus ainarchaeum sp.]|nr:N-glycosylase/DNA lyase [Candidatus ainarchaeum sp.]